MKSKIKNMTVYLDTDSDPANPGYVLGYDVGDEIGQKGLTEPLDADDADEAFHEAAQFVGFLPEQIICAECGTIEVLELSDGAVRATCDCRRYQHLSPWDLNSLAAEPI